jgi:hypothetical protein
MLVIFVCCVTAAAGRLLVRAVESSSARAVFVLLVLALPVLLLVAVSGLRRVVEWLHRRR